MALDLLYVSAQLAWWYTLTGAMMVESGRLVAQSLTLDLAADVVHAGCAEDLQKQHAQPVSDLRQGRVPAQCG